MNCLMDEDGSAALSRFYDGIFALETSSQVCSYFDQYILQACQRSMKQTGNPQTSKFPIKEWYNNDCKMAKAAYHEAEKRGEPQDVLNEMQCEYRRVIQRAKRRHNFDNFFDIQTCQSQKDLWQKLKKLKSKNTQSGEDHSVDDFHEFYSKPAIDNENNCHDFDQGAMKRG